MGVDVTWGGLCTAKTVGNMSPDIIELSCMHILSQCFAGCLTVVCIFKFYSNLVSNQ